MSSALIAASAVTTQARINYPDTRRVDTVDNYFGTLGEVGQTLLNVIASLEQ